LFFSFLTSNRWVLLGILESGGELEKREILRKVKPNLPNSEEVRTIKETIFVLPIRFTYDGRKCGSGIFIVPLHKKWASQHWKSVISLYLFDGNEKEMIERSRNFGEFIQYQLKFILSFSNLQI
jgi:hypothetical protein